MKWLEGERKGEKFMVRIWRKFNSLDFRGSFRGFSGGFCVVICYAGILGRFWVLGVKIGRIGNNFE